MKELSLTQDEVERILWEFKKKISEILKDKFIELILFGSYARGDYEFGSDIDVLLVLKEKFSKKEKERVSKLSADLSLEHDTVITCFEYLEEGFKNWETPFLSNVRREGVRI
ncbi:MAG: nucleotidyltransferase domain-containing protein [Candidatus Methanofastidiosia archaeon]